MKATKYEIPLPLPSSYGTSTGEVIIEQEEVHAEGADGNYLRDADGNYVMNTEWHASWTLTNGKGPVPLDALRALHANACALADVLGGAVARLEEEAAVK